jgi:hypothetical protein
MIRPMPARYGTDMKRSFVATAAVLLCWSGGIAHAALPVEHQVHREATAIGVGPGAHPVGVFEYASNRVERRHLSPWRWDTRREQSADELIFFDDGAIRSEGNLKKHPQSGRLCRIAGDVTVCRTEPLTQ